mgnify:CR=1 FL=1
MTDSLYWYDFETTGIDPVVDRPLQFAGLRTDFELNEVSEPQNILCKPGTDIVPQPEALLVTKILMSRIVDEGISERAFAEKVLEQFSQPQTCVVGFNSLRFDDEFTRQMLYRNFHDPYSREWRNGNSRWDVIDLFRATYALRPEGVNWPRNETGDPSFRLEDLARENGITHSDAHDALADVRATIAVTKLLRQAQPKIYDFMFALRDKKAVLQQLYPLGKKPVIHVSSMYPASRGCTAVVLPLCQHPTNGNAIICFDLSQSTEDLLHATPSELGRLVFTKSVELKDTEERIALKTIQINRCPFVAPISTLGPEVAKRLGIDLRQCEEHMAEIMKSAGVVEKIQEAFAHHQFDSVDDPDHQLYQGGFFSEADKSTMRELLVSPPDQLVRFSGKFQDDRLDEMLFRFRGRNHLDTFNEDELLRWNQYRYERWSIEQVSRDIEQLMSDCDEESRLVLAELEKYIVDLGKL